MKRYVAFLRGMNLGRRRIKNDELCACFEALGYENVSAFLASGNVVFDAAGRDAARVAKQIETGLAESLGYPVPTFLRTAEEVRAIAGSPLLVGEAGQSGGKLQVALLATQPTAAARSAVLELGTEEDRLAFSGRELYWLPSGPMTQSELSSRAVEGVLGPMTVRTRRTIERLAAKFLSD